MHGDSSEANKATPVATFKTLNWSDLDTWAIAAGHGVVTLHHEDQLAASTWLKQHKYEVFHLDFANGITPVVKRLGIALGWSSQFGAGHELRPESRNLDSLRDGFRFDVPELGGLVLSLDAFEIAWKEDPRWSAGFLAIVSEFSLQQMALGNRFFAVIEFADAASVLLDSQFEKLLIGYPFKFRAAAV